jgi:hypothetical protein
MMLIDGVIRTRAAGGMAAAWLVAGVACAGGEPGVDSRPDSVLATPATTLTPEAVEASFEAQAVNTPPRFEDYPPLAAYVGRTAAAEPGAHAADPALVAAALAKGPNFAGHLVVVRVPCPQAPDECGTLLLVDANDGVIVEGPQVPAEVVYRPDSRLLVIDTPRARPNMRHCAGCTAAYMEWTGEALDLIPPETWVASAPPPSSERARIARIRAEESETIARHAPAVTRPRWDRLLIRTENGSRLTFVDELSDGAVRMLHRYRGPMADGVHVVEVEGEGGRSWKLIDAKTGEVTDTSGPPPEVVLTEPASY